MPMLLRTLHKGRTSALLDGADLRYITVDGVEVLRRIHVTVRDAAWGTPPVTGLETTVRETPDAIVVEATAAQGADGVAVSWRATASIHADGTVRYRVAVTVLDEFAFNRIGLCALHPPQTCAGRPYRTAGGAGDAEGLLPETVAPEHLAPFDRLAIDVRGLGWCRLALAGDLFELEDQRNWSDGSFKTYCTPLDHPLPQQARPGGTIEQAIELTVPRAARAAARRSADDVVTLEAGEATGRPFPELGLGCGAPLSGAAAGALRDVAPDHLRVDLRAPEQFDAVLAQAAADAALLGCRLTLAVHLGADPDAELTRLAALVRELDPPVARVLALSRLIPASTGDLVTRARERLSPLMPAAMFAGGTDVWFVDLNGARPELAAMDGVAWSITPQVHGHDELTMIEALAAQTDQARSARAFSGELALLVGPITLRPRYNPHAPDAAAQALHPPPSSIDPRQGTPFAAAWTAGSVAALAQGGVDAATFYETAGPRGVLAADGADPLPCGRVLGWASGWRGWDVFRTCSSAPLRAAALVVRPPGGGEPRGLLINLTAQPQRVRLGGAAVGDGELAPWEVARL